MKTVMKRVSIAASLAAALLFAAGWFMQGQKANIDTLPAEQFDDIMKLYYAGNALITAALCVAAIAAVSWIATAIIRAKG